MAKKRVAVTNENSALFDTAKFSSKNHIGGSTDSAWDDGSAFPEVSFKKIWAVGDRTLNNALIQEIRDDAFLARWDNGYSNWYAIADLETGYARMPISTDRWNPNHFGETARIADGNQLSIFWDDSLEPPDPSDFENLEEYNEAWTQWELDSLTSAQELGQDSHLPAQSLDLTSLEPQRLTPTVAASLQIDIQESTITATCDTWTIQEQSILFPLPPLAPPSPQKAIAGEQTTSEIASPQSSKLSENCNPNSSPSKTLQAYSPVPTDQIQDISIFQTYSDSLPSAGTMRNGLLSAVDTLTAPTLEKGYCWLPSPGALSSTGKGRPPGQTKQEGGLKNLGAIAPGQVVNPEFLESAYNLPLGWTNPRENKSASELLAEMELLEVAAQRSETPLTGELQRSPYNESSTLTPCVENQPLARANAQPETYIINQSQTLGKVIDNLGFGFTVNWLDSSELITYNWERDNQQIIGLAIAPQHLIDKFLKEKLGYETIQENFLEETQPQQEAVQKPKGRQRKGCLYRYIENKKLKSGAIASYPRVIGHREPSNPQHWRWGYNWEEKIDGEWKGRSIGSVPVGAIALIQSMQNEGVSLEEIIEFIRRAKSKKS